VRRGFTVLLGPDRAGKTSVLTALTAAEPERLRAIGLDDELAGPRHRAVPALRRLVVRDVLTALRGPRPAYSPDFAMSLLQGGVVHLRDRVMENDPAGRDTLVDSYYYKILAKCRLLGCADAALDWWRGFPQPDLVVWLDVPPEEAWRRGGTANILEHYGERYERASFLAYQRDLAAAMREEVTGLPVVTVPVQPDLSATVAAVRAALYSQEEVLDVAA
jgi:thymidylate kinase